MKTNIPLLCVLAILITLLSLSCQSDEADEVVPKTEDNPFSNIKTLDCRNLIIRNVSLNENIVEVTLENTCKSCEDDWAYLNMVMIDRTTLRKDTVAQMICYCLTSPRNGKSEKYQLETNLTTLPDLKSIQFNFDYLCTDMTNLKK